MADFTAEQIAQRVFDLNLVDDRGLMEVWGTFDRRNIMAEDFLQAAVRRELLTNFQVERLLKGERTGYFYGKYKILYRVASGTFARVYRAVEEGTGRVVALKVLRRRYSDDPRQTEQFGREGQVGLRLRHPNIVPVFGVHSGGLIHYFVMEFIEGRNMRDFVKGRRRVEPIEATRLLIDMTTGIKYAFDRGVLHRDVKMTNVLVSSRGQAKLVDFGLAHADERMSDEELARLPNPRTVDYAGLERATGVRKDDPRSDVYFLGCVYYHVLVGRAPLSESRDRMHRLSKTRYMDVVPVRDADSRIPAVVAQVVSKAMEFDPNLRYQTPGELLVDLSLALEQLTQPDDRADTQEAGDHSTSMQRRRKRRRRQRQRSATAPLPDSAKKVLMFVESSTRMQDIFREGMKRWGYRVLLTANPDRCRDRFADDEHTADCVVFSTGHLGRAAMEAFNEFAEDQRTAGVPAVLLLGEEHADWSTETKTGEKRIVLTMPLKLRDFREAVTKLVPPLATEGSLHGNGD